METQRQIRKNQENGSYRRRVYGCTQIERNSRQKERKWKTETVAEGRPMNGAEGGKAKTGKQDRSPAPEVGNCFRCVLLRTVGPPQALGKTPPAAND